MLIDLSKIVPNPEQPRRVFDEQELAALADSIRQHGVIQAITVEDAGEGCYILHDGERRLRAARIAGLTQIEATITPSLNGDGAQQRLLRALVANGQRSDLNPIEQAEACGRLARMGYSKSKIAKLIGYTDPFVAGRLLLLELDKPIQDLVAAGNIPTDIRCTKALLTLPSEVRIKLATRMARPGLGIDAVARACERVREQLDRAGALRDKQPPACVLSGAKPEGSPTSWKTLYAATQGVCERCESNPRIPDLPAPAWSVVLQKSDQVCERCSMRKQAIQSGLSICKGCPLVEMLRELVGAQP